RTTPLASVRTIDSSPMKRPCLRSPLAHWFLRSLALGRSIPVATCVCLVTPSHAADRVPNIVYIMADDLGYADIGPFGQKKIHTPNLDRFAREGTCFDQFYPGGSVCSPTRTTLMTGLHTGHAWIRGNHGNAGLSRVPLRPQDLTVAELLKSAGYATAIA